MKVTMKNPRTGELKQVKIGWSWTLFFFSGFFGVPLFLRKLYGWGGVCLAMCVISLFSAIMSAEEELFAVVNALISIAMLVIEIYLAIKGNEITAKNYLDHGWVFAEPNGDILQLAKGKWGIQ